MTKVVGVRVPLSAPPVPAKHHAAEKNLIFFPKNCLLFYQNLYFCVCCWNVCPVWNKPFSRPENTSETNGWNVCLEEACPKSILLGFSALSYIVIVIPPICDRREARGGGEGRNGIRFAEKSVVSFQNRQIDVQKRQIGRVGGIKFEII